MSQSAASRVEKSKEQLNREIENIIALEFRSLLLQSNDKNSDRKPMHPAESKLINLANHIHASSSSANTAQQPHVCLSKDQSGWNYVSSSANNFLSSVASPIIPT